MSSFAILGATGSVGSCLARRLVQGGHSVLLLGRNVDKLRSLAELLNQPSAVVSGSDSSLVEQAIREQLPS